VNGLRQRNGTHAGVVSIFMSKGIENQSLPVDGNRLQVRDFTYVDDVVECNLLSAKAI